MPDIIPSYNNNSYHIIIKTITLLFTDQVFLEKLCPQHQQLYFSKLFLYFTNLIMWYSCLKFSSTLKLFRTEFEKSHRLSTFQSDPDTNVGFSAFPPNNKYEVHVLCDTLCFNRFRVPETFILMKQCGTKVEWHNVIIKR